MVGLPDSEKNFEDMYNRLDRISACDGRTDRQTDRQTDGQTDGRTDGRTSCHGIVHAMHMCIRFDRVHERDTQTDTWTPHDGIGRACIASRGKKSPHH